MKPSYTLLACLLLLLVLSTSMTHAQGIYQLWGMTKDGGDDNEGTMFSTNAAGNNFQERRQFNISNAGAFPQLGNLVECNGKFYGMTQAGGYYNSGVIFEWNAGTNTYTRKYSFNADNGSGPLGSLVLYNGKLYGMTEFGGFQGIGVIFEFDPATNVYTKKTDFIDNPIDGFFGSRPAGGLTMNAGKFYGMTTYGGDNDLGVIFEWDPSTNVYTKKIDLESSSGYRPYGNLVLKSGKFYGLTNLGGINDQGVIFEWDPFSNDYTKKISLSTANGSYPYGSLALKGSKFYGITQKGGSNDAGAIFEWNPSNNAFSKKYDLVESEGNSPSGSLTLNGTKFYGTAFRGGANDRGVIFEWDPATNTYTKKIDLSNENGRFPQADLLLSNGKFYAMTTQGGVTDKGVIFEWNPTGNIYTKKIDLNDVSKGLKPTGSFAKAAGKFYGMTNSGGANGVGVIFEFDAASNQYTKKIDLHTSTGSVPYGNLTYSNGKFYGMTLKGGTDDEGAIFEYNPSTNQYSMKVDMSFDDGSSPRGSLSMYAGKLYGMTNAGGNNGVGVIFEFDPVTDAYAKKIDLSSSIGSQPYGNLVLNGDKFYGMTYKGGANASGTIFEWDPVSNGYTKKIDLNNTRGKFPAGSLSLYNGKFYGMASQGGGSNKGVIFEWDPAGNTYTKKLDFSTTDAFNPLGSLTMSSGKFYGMTRSGGANNGGVVFEWDPATNIYTKTRDLSPSVGGFPGIVNDLSLTPAPVAKGVENNCVSFASVTIDNSNNNIWVPIVDDKGDAVAEIKANGNNLGIVDASMYINNGAVREDGANKLYLDRNLTLTPQFQPGSPVDIRLYIKNSEYLALKNAVNSMGQPSGIMGIEDVGIYKNSDGCLPSIAFIANPVIITNTEQWENDFVFTATIFSFSSFYFSNKAQGGPLPVTGLELSGRLINDYGDINWKTTDEYKTKSFDLERSTDGRSYNAITNVAAMNQPGLQQYSYYDKEIISLKAPFVYYRIKQKDIDNRFTYSNVVALNVKSSSMVLLYPNPVPDKATVVFSTNKPEIVQGRIIDNTGRTVKQLQWHLVAGSNSFTIDVNNLAGGMYYLELKGETINERKQFVKQ